ncbi:hypothetical protein GQ54DRAFT_313278 [Martensiomyces pterosporus]|nr:hypothetical protein GQ54DRAFT_313278 [Martensiomyces pterosporus]
MTRSQKSRVNFNDNVKNAILERMFSSFSLVEKNIATLGNPATREFEALVRDIIRMQPELANNPHLRSTLESFISNQNSRIFCALYDLNQWHEEGAAGSIFQLAQKNIMSIFKRPPFNNRPYTRELTYAQRLIAIYSREAPADWNRLVNAYEQLHQLVENEPWEKKHLFLAGIGVSTSMPQRTVYPEQPMSASFNGVGFAQMPMTNGADLPMDLDAVSHSMDTSPLSIDSDVAERSSKQTRNHPVLQGSSVSDAQGKAKKTRSFSDSAAGESVFSTAEPLLHLQAAAPQLSTGHPVSSIIATTNTGIATSAGVSTIDPTVAAYSFLNQNAVTGVSPFQAMAGLNIQTTPYLGTTAPALGALTPMRRTLTPAHGSQVWSKQTLQANGALLSKSLVDYLEASFGTGTLTSPALSSSPPQAHHCSGGSAQQLSTPYAQTLVHTQARTRAMLERIGYSNPQPATPTIEEITEPQEQHIPGFNPLNGIR